MKKIFVVAFAALAICFASCNNKATNAAEEAVDSVAMVQQEADDIIGQLTQQLEAKDANAIESALQAVQEKIAELVNINPDLAKAYVTKVQDFLKTNAESIKTVVGEKAAAAAALTALTGASTDDIVSTAINAAKESAVDAAKDAAKEAVNGAVEDVKNAGEKVSDAFENTKEAAKQSVEDAKENAKQSAAKTVDNAANSVKKGLGLN